MSILREAPTFRQADDTFLLIEKFETLFSVFRVAEFGPVALATLRDVPKFVYGLFLLSEMSEYSDEV